MYRYNNIVCMSSVSLEIISLHLEDYYKYFKVMLCVHAVVQICFTKSSLNYLPINSLMEILFYFSLQFFHS